MILTNWDKILSLHLTVVCIYLPRIVCMASILNYQCELLLLLRDSLISFFDAEWDEVLRKKHTLWHRFVLIHTNIQEGNVYTMIPEGSMWSLRNDHIFFWRSRSSRILAAAAVNRCCICARRFEYRRHTLQLRNSVCTKNAYETRVCSFIVTLSPATSLQLLFDHRIKPICRFVRWLKSTNPVKRRTLVCPKRNLSLTILTSLSNWIFDKWASWP